MTGVEVMPICGVTWLHPWVSLVVSPLPFSETIHKAVPEFTSKAYTESFSVATNATLWLAPATARFDR